MDSNKMYDVRMLVVVSTSEESVCREVQQELLEFCPNLSFSPIREQQSLNNALEFHATGTCTAQEKEAMLGKLDNDFDEEDGLYYAYSFNTKMWDPRVYYIQMEF